MWCLPILLKHRIKLTRMLELSNSSMQQCLMDVATLISADCKISIQQAMRLMTRYNLAGKNIYGTTHALCQKG